MGDKISVIVPIYNVEPYLRRCIDSIINQTYENLEIILVDDGSRDNCGQICDDYAKKDTRIKVIHKKNGGLSDARNTGLEVCTGNFISFVDSDDWIDKTMLQVMINLMKSNESDICECGVEYVYENKNILQSENLNSNISIFNKEESLNNLLLNNIRQTVWNKLYKSTVIKNMFFEIGKCNEDEFWTYKILDKINKVVKTEQKLYYYYQRNGSIINSRYSMKNLDALEAKYERVKFLNKYPDIQKEACRQIIFDSLYHYQKCSIYLNKNEREKAQNYIKKKFSEVNINDVYLRNLSLKENIWFLFSKISLDMVAKIRNFLNIGI